MAALLACDPNEIVFAVDPSKKTLQTFVTVRNTSEEAHVAFSVKTTQPKLYAVRPPQGVLGPRQSVSVTVLMSNRKPPATLGLQKQDKFLFQFGYVCGQRSAFSGSVIILSRNAHLYEPTLHVHTTFNEPTLSFKPTLKNHPPINAGRFPLARPMKPPRTFLSPRMAPMPTA